MNKSLLTLCILSQLILWGGVTVAHAEVNPAIQEGIDLYNRGKVEEAIAKFEGLLKSDTLDKYETARVQEKLKKYREFDRLQKEYLALAKQKEELGKRPIPSGELADSYVVRPGDTLWLIASYGYVYNDITMGSRLYEANRDVLSNPDLIYPGQVLKIAR